MKQLNFSFINLWCNKNLVDTQFLLWNIFSISNNNPNYEINYINDPYDNDVEYIFLNSCGFLSSGRYEMFKEIDKLISTNKKVYLLGCALQYFETIWKDKKDEIELKKRDEITKNENIHFISWTDRNNITIEQIINWFNSNIFGESPIFNWIRAYTNIDYWFEYLKIAEWCNNKCSFCIIPKIRWKQKSLPIEQVLKQAQELVDNWAKEIILLAQDTNRYWIDLYWKSMLLDLMEELEKIQWDFMYRILYLYPDILTLNHLEKLKKFKKFIPYFDIPLQHISENILKSMWRFYNQQHIFNLLDYINKNFEEKFIRTNIIVWFPWETQKEFDELCEFLKKYKFDNVALFEYHDEPLAESSKLDWKVDNEEIHRRFEILNNIINNKWIMMNNKKEEIWFIMWFEWNESNPTIIVRPRLHAPEIDEYDEIKLKDIKWVFSDSTELDIWSKIQYKKKETSYSLLNRNQPTL